jgi:UPF0042 nucleotide-binding protein
MQMVEFVVVTGLSGAGKTQALRALEDMGFFCVDNLPPALMGMFADLCAHSDRGISRVGLVMDVRGGDFFGDLLAALDNLKGPNVRLRVVYLEADDDVIMRRFEETRRKHPLASEGGLPESIRDERAMLTAIRTRADYVINTTSLPPHLLKRKLAAAFNDIVSTETLLVQVLSFGFKHGLPTVCDLVFDIRFLPNPHHEPTLRALTGMDEAVRQHVLDSNDGREFMQHLRDFLSFCLPQYAREGKAYLTIGIGCTGGRHRSVTVGEDVATWVRTLGYTVTVRHRDLEREKANEAYRPPAEADGVRLEENGADACVAKTPGADDCQA